MRISLLCSDTRHPINPYLERWICARAAAHDIQLARRKSELVGGDLLFLISCSEIIDPTTRQAYAASLVLHASDLPHGRGWSPHIWQIIDGASHITLSLLEAEDPVDSGRIWHQQRIDIPAHALWDEINHALFQAEIKLIDHAIDARAHITPTPQDPNTPATYYPRRTPADSALDPHQSIASQFNRLRVCDPQRFPAHFELHGHTYKLTLEKLHD